MNKSKAICLLSGGLDSTTVLGVALERGFDVRALTIHYGQLHSKEIRCARHIAGRLKIAHHFLKIALPWKGSALLDQKIKMPVHANFREMKKKIPATYVPARNSVFLAQELFGQPDKISWFIADKNP